MGFHVFLKLVNGAVHSNIDWQIIPDCWCYHLKSPIPQLVPARIGDNSTC